MIIITNNIKVINEMNTLLEKEYIEGSYKDVLISVRDRIHKGHKLISHPLSGSVKPNETPYKSIVISKVADKLDTDSLYIIEDSIAACEKFDKRTPKFKETNRVQILKDYSEIDYWLLESALKSSKFR